MKLGARMLKTGISVAVALYFANLIGLPSATFAGIAAAFAIQPNIYRSFQTILEQIQANIIGVGLATFVAFSLGNDPIIIGFTIVTVIGICMSLRMNENTIALAIIAVLAMMETTDQELLTFAGLRFSSLTLGIVSAFVVNLLFLPPKYETKLFRHIDLTTADVLQWLRITTRHLSDDPALKSEIQRIQNELRHIDSTYLLFSEERTYLKKTRLPKARKLIIFRQLILTSHKSFDVLKAFHHFDDKIETIPDKFQHALIEELDKVIYAHERLLLSAMGRIKKNRSKSIEEITEPDIPYLVESLIQVYNEDDANHLSLLPLASQLMEYHHELMHMQKLLNSYQSFHGNHDFDFKDDRKKLLPFK
ncbi:uncharacterized membrane protein YgaE (UPF0421/DUF939 family) [Saliterribacillus persicus]|uniref:Uncharacterized membrane protein YgaE (UPF0421/DUF939 family) n=2 Tax=Saliterribacillus persicus TaxID=930114 RepID=A0A368X6E9_9BACI|nr:aromatic acid exporter family protein [Saliterribacillus persicus]RCW62558.1 uncharacterized membrane protein YgaE (UPF0421/DUF939 family) [Saliterribacillus persicus]